MKARTKAQEISSLVRSTLANNGDIKLDSFQALIKIVGGKKASKLLDMKIVSQFKANPLTLSERRQLVWASNGHVKQVDGKVCARVFGRYVRLFNY